jgi:hypothetical protein
MLLKMQLLAGCHTSTISVTTCLADCFACISVMWHTCTIFTVSTGKTSCALPVSCDSLPGKPGVKWYIMENVQHTHTAPDLQVKNWHVPVRHSELCCTKTEVHVCHWVCIRYTLTVAGRHLPRIGYFHSVNEEAYQSWMSCPNTGPVSCD